MNIYLLVYNYGNLPRQKMLDFLDTVPQVRNWRALHNAIFIVSAVVTAAEVRQTIHEKFPNLNFFVAKIDGVNTDGWADKETWEFINNLHVIR